MCSPFRTAFCLLGFNIGCHSERSEESQIILSSRHQANSPRCFASLNMTIEAGLTPCLRFLAQDLSISPELFPKLHSSPNLIIPAGAGFVGSNLTLALQEKFPDGRLTVIDDFRSGDFKNLRGYRGDLVAQNLATLDWTDQFGNEKFDAIFYFASITDTTMHDQFVQVHDNV